MIGQENHYDRQLDNGDNLIRRLDKGTTHTNNWTKEPLRQRFGLGDNLDHRTRELFR